MPGKREGSWGGGGGRIEKKLEKEKVGRKGRRGGEGTREERREEA